MLAYFRHIRPFYTIYRYCSALSIRMRMCIYITITTGSVPFKHNENTYQKGEYSCKCTELFLKRKEEIHCVAQSALFITRSIKLK